MKGNRERDFEFEWLFREMELALSEDRSRNRWAMLSIAKSLHELVIEVRGIREELAPKLQHVEITIMPKTIAVGQTALAHLTGTGSDGNPFLFTSANAVSLAAANPASVSFGAPTFNADGSADVVVTGVAADPGDAIAGTVDGVVSNTDTLVITAAAATLASVNLVLQ